MAYVVTNCLGPECLFPLHRFQLSDKSSPSSQKTIRLTGFGMKKLSSGHWSVHFITMMTRSPWTLSLLWSCVQEESPVRAAFIKIGKYGSLCHRAPRGEFTIAQLPLAEPSRFWELTRERGNVYPLFLAMKQQSLMCHTCQSQPSSWGFLLAVVFGLREQSTAKREVFTLSDFQILSFMEIFVFRFCFYVDFM